MRPSLTFYVAITISALAGCESSTRDFAAPSVVTDASDRPSYPAPTTRTEAKVGGETERDKAFARFLADHSGGMIAKASVGIEKLGLLRVVLDRSVAPEETLELTKSLMEGARKEFPDKPITLAIFDPGEAPILKAKFRPGQGVRYEIAHQAPGPDKPEILDDSGGTSIPPATKSSNSGVTERDRKFAIWAEEKGRTYLRYVEADVDRNGRLWFGVTREIKPADVTALTQALLEGARQEFPGKKLVANVFDPEGERIGTAHLEPDGKVRWSK